MFWQKIDKGMRIPIKSWCKDVEPGAMQQAVNLASHPKTVEHVALMPDCHVGYGMPIGGVIACDDAVIPNAVGVDIGCGMAAVQTTKSARDLPGKAEIRRLLDEVKALVPVGEGHAHRKPQKWSGFGRFRDELQGPQPAWLIGERWQHDMCNLGTLGGGNHFLELQVSDQGDLWLMVHSGSRNLGYRIADAYHKRAQHLCADQGIALPDRDLAYLAADSAAGQAYIRDMTFALRYALENRHRMMATFKHVLERHFPGIEFTREVNIHHNFAALERHAGREVWVHRKGATSAKKDEVGIIPGSMGTASYIVAGQGAAESFTSCSHGAGRVMGRMEACRRLTAEACDEAMGDVVYDRWSRVRGRRGKRDKMQDLSEAPLAYKDIDAVIAAESDLVTPIVRLRPIGVVKG